MNLLLNDINVKESIEIAKDELNFLEENILSSANNIYEKDASGITIIPCRTKTEECQSVAAEIKRLVRTQKLRYRDIAVIVRNEEKYKNTFASDIG